MGLTAGKIGRVSPYHTASGVHVVDGLIAQAMGDGARYRAAVNRFAAAAGERCATRDLTLGRAGVLIGAALLLDARPPGSDEESATLRTLGNATLQGVLLGTGPDSGAAAVESSVGIAHGAGGMLYAALRWTRSAGVPVPAKVAPSSTGSRRWPGPTGAGSPGHAPKRTKRRRAMTSPAGAAARRAWCISGLPRTDGAVARHPRPGRVERLVSVGRAGGYPTSAAASLAGRTRYSLLYRHGGNTEWLRRAQVLGARAGRALERLGELPYPLSLFKGAPGIIVLLADLSRPESACMPFFETEGWPAVEAAT